MTVLVVVSITDTRVAGGVGDVDAGAVGADRHTGGTMPTRRSVAMTVLVVVSITDTVNVLTWLAM